MKKNLFVTYPEGKLRILPKKGTFRPIITFNRKVEFMTDGNPPQKLKATLNQILGDTQLVLRGLKNILGRDFGYCIFDNRQIMRRYDAFVKNWRDNSCPHLKYFTLDIKKCYDSINTSLLMEII
jgi:telomerase reverse transcriptase